MIVRREVIRVEVTPEELASEFAKASADEQAAFFVELARLMELWDRPAAMQLQAITDSEVLDRPARYLMERIGHYAWPYTEKGDI
jgi:chorismate mutase